MKDNKLNKNIIIIIGVSLLTIVIILLVVFLNIGKKDEEKKNTTKELTEFSEDLLKKESESLIEEAISLNKLVSSDYYDEEDTLILQDNRPCYAYNKDDAKEVIERLRNTYHINAREVTLFRITKNDKTEGKDKLYVCPLKDYCTVTTKVDNVEYEKDDTVASIIADTASYAVVEEKGKLKLTSELYSCDLEKLKEDMKNQEENKDKEKDKQQTEPGYIPSDEVNEINKNGAKDTSNEEKTPEETPEETN